jgi:cytochrome c oxidase assembly factor CtaG
MLNGLDLTWPSSLGVVVFLIALSLLYLLGVWRARIQHTKNPQEKPVKAHHIFLFFLAIVFMALLLLTPIDTIGRTQLFMVHMAQAVLLTTLCAPLVFAGSPAILLRPLLNAPVIRSIVRWRIFPIAGSIVFNVTFLVWQTPMILEACMKDPGLYQWQMLSIFLTSLLNWWPLIGSVHEVRRMSYPLQIMYAFFDGQPLDILALLLLFTGGTIYHYAVPAQLGISAFGDQATGGALLLIPGIVDLVVMSPLFFRWLRQVEERTKRDDLRRQEEEEEEEEEEA